jgi:hypothetical protein
LPQLRMCLDEDRHSGFGPQADLAKVKSARTGIGGAVVGLCDPHHTL